MSTVKRADVCTSVIHWHHLVGQLETIYFELTEYRSNNVWNVSIYTISKNAEQWNNCTHGYTSMTNDNEVIFSIGEEKVHK